MNWLSLPNSSSISKVAYDSDSQFLHVQFANGSVYRYHQVPESEYQALLGADSPGQYLASAIKGRYEFSRG
jgi:lysyl-tRNA synthetase, class II